MSVLKNNVDNPTIIVKSITIPGKSKNTKENNGNKSLIVLERINPKVRANAKKMKEANKFLEASSALHRALTPTMVPEEEFVYNAEEGWTKVQAPENYFKAVNFQNLQPPNTTPFRKGAVQILEGSKLLNTKSTQKKPQDPLSEYRINCGPIKTASKTAMKKNKNKTKGNKTQSKLCFKQSLRNQDTLKAKKFLRSSSGSSRGEVGRPEDILPNPEKPFRQLPCRPPKKYSRRQIYSGRIANITDINYQKEHNLEVLLQKRLDENKDIGDDNFDSWWKLYLNQETNNDEINMAKQL